MFSMGKVIKLVRFLARVFGVHRFINVLMNRGLNALFFFSFSFLFDRYIALTDLKERKIS